MALLFNLTLLESKTNCDPVKLVETLKLYFLRKKIPKNSRSKVKPLPNLFGNSFLLNPESLFKNTAEIVFQAQYIRLAGRRDYGMYKIFGHTFLDLSYFSDLNLDALKHNPLLTIKDNKIYFKYEEIKNGT